MSLRPKTILYYVIIFGFTAFLIWISLRGLKVTEGVDKWSYLRRTWQSADKLWLLVMAGIALLSHLVRAERWRMLMVPAGYHPKLSHSFYSLMVGYFVNLAIPRGGEVSRCYNLYKLDGTPADMSFGTVVVERIADLICLVLLIALCFLVESEKLFSFLTTLPFGIESGKSKLFVLGVVVVSLVLFVFFFRWLMKKNQKFREMVQRAWTGFSAGLGTVFKLKNKGLFIFYSLLIWFLYFLTSYAVLQAFSSTSELGVGAVLSLFAIGSIAMAAPLPGGTGSYHVLVPQGLAFLYHVPLADAVAFTFIFHGCQTAIMIICGANSLLITSYKVRINTVKLEQH
jgi:glycosyltransferase 2 family protein